jgi:hypothetical protein
VVRQPGRLSDEAYSRSLPLWELFREMERRNVPFQMLEDRSVLESRLAGECGSWEGELHLQGGAQWDLHRGGHARGRSGRLVCLNRVVLCGLAEALRLETGNQGRPHYVSQMRAAGARLLGSGSWWAMSTSERVLPLASSWRTVSLLWKAGVDGGWCAQCPSAHGQG